MSRRVESQYALVHMTRGPKAAFLLVLVGACFAVVASPRAQEEPGERFTVSLPTFTLRNQESVFGFVCAITGGGIVSLNIPYLWMVKVDNGSGQRARVDAHIIVGVARFCSATQLSYFHDFMTVEKRQGQPRFGVTVKVIVATDPDLETHRLIKFKSKAACANAETLNLETRSFGTVQDLSYVYPPKKTGPMTNHVHFDIRYGNEYLDPTPLVTAWQNVP